MTGTVTGYDGTTNPGFSTTYVSLNALRDLDGAGTQPAGYDTLITMFKRYKVLSVRATVVFAGRNTGVERATAYPCFPDYVPTTTKQACERPYSKTVLTNMHQFNTIDFNVPMNQLCGPNAKTDNDYSGTSAASPTLEARLRLAWAPVVAGTTYISWFVKLVYDVLWTEPQYPAES